MKHLRGLDERTQFFFPEDAFPEVSLLCFSSTFLVPSTLIFCDQTSELP